MSIAKPKVAQHLLPKNALGLTRRDYEGGMSTLCAGCGHDSITAAIVEATWGLGIEPSRVAKMSGIGCSSKTTAYFLGASHGFNGVHGRMPSLASGANAANRELHYIGVSGDGDSLSIGLGQLAHAIRRNVNMLYLIENNGVYVLTKGQFSASADVGSKSKKGDANLQAPVDPVLLALSLGATFVARGFSGDKKQLVPLIQAGLQHRGFALIDVLSPCVTFNDHEGSTKSYAYTREHYHPAVETDFIKASVADDGHASVADDVPASVADFVPRADEIAVDYEAGTGTTVRMHDGSHVRLHKLDPDYDPTDRLAAYEYLSAKLKEGEHVTGLIHVDPSGGQELHEMNGTTDVPLNRIPYEKLSPGSGALAKLMARYR